MSSAMQPDDPGAEQPFITHLVELRDRIIRMLIAVGVVALVLLPFANDIYTYVAAPLIAQLPAGNTMIATQVASPFLTPFKLALIAAVFLAIPYLLYQLWAFVAPGLYQHEKRLAVPLLVSSIALFYIGMAFAYYLVFPLVFRFMAGSTPDGVAMMTDISAYLDFVLTLFFAFGIAFEVPIATVLLVLTGAVAPDDLANKRPYVIVGAFVIGMVLTPPDVFSQTLLAVPMWLLFEVGVFFSRMLLKQSAKTTESTSTGPPPPAAGAPPPTAASSAADGASAPNTPNSRHPVPSRAGADAADDWQPLSSDDMEAELDLMDAEDAKESADEPRRHTGRGSINAVEAKLERANRLRDLNNEFAARQMLYEVLEEGDPDQRRVARNILQQLDDQ